MLARLITLVLIVTIVVMVMRRLRVGGKATRGPRTIDAQAVRCEHCQVYFPHEEAVSRGGLLYCCAAHAEQARRPT